MRSIVLLALTMASPSMVAAEPVFGASITAGTDSQLKDGGFKGGGAGAWLAYAWSPVYAGGELQVETYTRGAGDFSSSYHAVVGARARLSSHVTVLGDAGIGVSAQVHSPGLLEDDHRSKTLAWKPSGALRLQLLARLGTTGQARWSLGVATDARSTVAHDSHGVGIGVGLVIDR